MYTFKDLASEKFVLLNEADLLKIEDVKGITVLFVANKPKKIIVNIGLFDFLFATTLKETLRAKIKKDLSGSFEVAFGI